MGYEYKCIGAPERPKRKRGAKTRSDRLAAAMEDLISAEAVDGWEYLRTDLVPVEERSGWFSRSQEVHRAVLVFRRAKEAPAGHSGMHQTHEHSGAPRPDSDRIRLAAEREPAVGMPRTEVTGRS